MTLAEILKDAKTFTDDMEMSLGEHKVKLGDLRTMSKSQQEDLQKRLDDAKRRQDEAADLGSKAAALLEELGKTQKTTPTSPSPTESDDFETAEWWQPVRKRLSAQEKAQQELKAAIENLTRSVGRAATIFAEDRWDSQYERNAERLRKIDKYKDWDMAKVRDYAVANKIVDRHGFPSVDRAIQELTREMDMEMRLQQAKEEGRREAEQKSRLASVTRPSSAAKRSANTNEKQLDPTKNFNDLGEAISDDPELTKMLSELGALSPEDMLQ